MLETIYSGVAPDEFGIKQSLAKPFTPCSSTLPSSSDRARSLPPDSRRKRKSYYHLTPPRSPAIVVSRSKPTPPLFKMQRREREPSESLSVPLACVVCRERHVKCDGRQPQCSRCQDSKQNCFYVQSRRGRRPSRKRDRSEESSSSASTNRRRASTLTVPAELDMTPHPPSQQRSPAYGQTSSSMPSPQPSIHASPGFHRAMSMSPIPTSIPRISEAPSVNHGGPSPDILQDLYYFYFHDNHPILLPQAYLPHTSQPMMPAPVQAAVQYIGSQFSSVAKNDPQYLRRLRECLFSPTIKRNKFTVQALILVGIVQRGQDRNDLAADTFDRAIDLALQLGMNRGAFAQENSEGSVIIQEMWKRCWWELYINDAILAEVQQSTYFRMNTIEADVILPWEEANYRDCNPGVSHSIYDLDNLAFTDNNVAVSSFSYRILAARTTALALKLNQPHSSESDDTMVSLDLALSNWQLHLPDRKKTPVDSEYAIDPMMFQAHLMINSTSIAFHRPHSNLIFTSIQDASTVTPSQRNTLPVARFATHTAKAIQSADRISNLLTLPGETIRHTPLIACAITLGAVVHLSAYVLSNDLGRSALIRDRLALSIGALKGLCYTWPLANEVSQHLQVAAKEVMTYGHQSAANAPILGSSVGYSDRAMTTDPWLAAMEDPLFAQIPELIPGSSVAVSMPGMEINTVPFTQ